MSASEIGGLQVFPSELADRDAWLEPFDWYAQMRQEAPVRYDPHRDAWDVFRYDDVKAVLEDDERFSASPRNLSGFEEPPADEGFLLDTMLSQDPPRHDELRSVVDDAFSPQAISELETRIRTLTSDLLDSVLSEPAGEFDLVERLSNPLPVIVIADMLGVPSEKRDQFKRWSDTIIRGADADEDAEAFAEKQRQAGQEMAAYFLEEIQDRRQNPRDDLLTVIATEEGSEGQLTQREALGMCMLLLIAGNITTTNLITNAVRCFVDQDGVSLADLAGSESQLSGAIEEVLRYRSPVQAMSRATMTDVELGGETIEAGENIIVWIGSANRDSQQFDDPETFRPDRSPTQHLAFGHGTHYCLGAPLARLEARVALEELGSRISGLEVTADDLQPIRSSFIYGVDSLPVQYNSA